jgi:transcriptional regulator with XRE-family HTH domain
MNVNVGKKIKELRLAKNMTQAEFAQRIGMTASTVSSYEVSERQPSYDVLIKIAKLFNVTTDFLLGYTNADMMNVTGLLTAQRENIQKIVETYQKFNEICITMLDLKSDADLVHLDSTSFEGVKFEIAKKNNFTIKKGSC